MFTGYRLFQCIRRFQYDGIIAGRVNLSIADGDIFTTVDVDTVAVGVDGHIVNSATVTAGGDNGKVTATEDSNIANQDVTA